MKKIISAILALSMLLGLSQQMIVEAGEILLEEYFDDEELNVPIVYYNNDGTASVNDGKLIIDRVSNEKGSYTGAEIYVDTDKKVRSGRFSISFVMSRESEELANLPVVFYGATGYKNPYLSINWHKNSELSVNYSKTQDSGASDEVVGVYDSDTLAITVEFDTDKKTMDVWADGIKILDSVYARSNQAQGVWCVYFSLEKSDIAKVGIDNFIVKSLPEEAVEDPQAVVEEDYNNLTEKNLIKVPLIDGLVEDSIYLPQYGDAGSDIVWSCDRPDIFTETGDLIALPETETLVNFRAELSCEDAHLEKEFTFNVKAAGDVSYSAATRYLYEERFDDESIDSRIICYESGGPIKEENGKIWLLYQGGSYTGIDIFPNNDQSELDGKFAISFIMNRPSSSNGTIPIQFYGPSYSSSFMSMDWEGSGEVVLNYSENKNESGEVTSLGEFDSERLKVLVEFDLNEGCFSLWLNNEIVLENKYPRDPSVKTIRSIWIYPDNSAPLSLSIDDFLAYKMFEQMPDEERVNLDAQELKLSDILTDKLDMPDSTNSNLNLYTIGNYGSRIEWSSSNEELITSDGIVNVPDNESGYSILTAKIISQDAVLEKSLLVNVPAANLPEASPPEIGETLLYDDFNTDTINPAFAVTEEGGRVEVSDGKLIIERNENIGATMVDMYNDAAQTPAYGFVGTTFTLSRSDNHDVLIRMRGGGSGNDYIALTWSSSSNIVVKIPNSAPGGATTDITVAKCSDTVNITTLYNTNNSTFSIWVDSKPVVKNAYSRFSGIYSHLYTRIYMEYENYNTLELSDYRVFSAIPGDYDSVITDITNISAQNIAVGGIPDNGMIQGNLVFEPYGQCGSNITWIPGPGIDESGNVTRPIGDELETYVIAVVEKNGISCAKKIDFTVMRDFESDKDRIETDAELLTYESITSQAPDSITKALSLSPSGKYGTSIVWESDTPGVISAAGRVVRPYNDKPAVNVTLTATLTCGTEKKELEFSFTVLPDEKLQDPNHMSDTEFFGEWDGSNWTTEGKLDYSIETLKPVEEAVKNGDYSAAKEELLNEFRSRENKQSVDMSERSPLWAAMVIDEIYHQSGDQYHQGEFIASGGEFQKYEVTVKTANIAKGSNSSYCIMARYNENSELEIATSRNENANLRPYLQLVVNGKETKIYPSADAGIRAGDYMDQNYGEDTVMKVKTFGEFLGNDTYKGMFRFNFADLGEDDTVESAKLVLFARVTPSYIPEKSILVLQEPTNLWENTTATWNNFPGYVFNYNGIEGGNTWDAIPGCDQEYTFQAPRFWAWTPVALEYSITGDEKYAYNALKISMDFIHDKGGNMKFTDGAWNGMTIRGGYPRTLDAAIRLQQWSLVLDTFAQSRYMTPEVLTAMLKHMWDIGYALTLAGNTHSPNWRQTENMALLQGGLTFSEFVDSKSWIEHACGVLEPMIYNNHFDDGSYLESTLGYNESSLKTFMEYKRLMYKNGREVSPEYDEMLKKAAYYACIMKGINGSNIQYGDEQGGLKTGAAYSEMVQWYGDDILAYIDSFGASGTRPDWTSWHFEDSQTTAMRSSWSKNGLALYTNVRGGGDGHGHADDNSVTIIGYDRILINDAGVFTYTDTDPLRKWGRSTIAHNTVEINNTSQKVNWATKDEGGTWGSTQDWTTNSKFDFLSQTTRSYDELGFSHRRSITFAKKGFWIISDRIEPKDGSKANDYKQVWHMMPTAAISYDMDNGQLKSNYATGGNIIVASADNDASLIREDGWYDYTYAQVQDAPFGYFKKTGSVGTTTFDTVLLPYMGTNAKIETERIDMGVDTSEITAIKFTYTANGETYTAYYMLDYTGENNEKQIGKYKTDAAMTVITEDTRGNIVDVFMQKGSYVKKDNTDIVKLSKLVEDFSYTHTGIDIEIVYSNSDLKNSDIKVAGFSAENVYVNEQEKAFETSGSMIIPSDSPATDDDDDESIHIKPDTSVGGGGSGGGGSGGSGGDGAIIVPETTPAPGTGSETVSFNDISGHWAENMILELAQNGIAYGEDNNFYPDRTITRAEAVALINRAGGIQDKTYAGGFEDVNGNEWYASQVEAALDAGIIAADRLFRPNDLVTREELAKIVTAMLLYKGVVLESYDLEFLDSDEISPWAIDYVKKAYASGIIRGDDEGNFRPKNNATRAEVVAMLYQVLNMTNGE